MFIVTLASYYAKPEQKLNPQSAMKFSLNEVLSQAHVSQGYCEEMRKGELFNHPEIFGRKDGIQIYQVNRCKESLMAMGPGYVICNWVSLCRFTFLFPFPQRIFML